MTKRIKVSLYPLGDMVWVVQVLTDTTPNNIDLVSPNTVTHCDVQVSQYNLMRVEVVSTQGKQGFEVKVDDVSTLKDKTDTNGHFNQLIGFEVK